MLVLSKYALRPSRQYPTCWDVCKRGKTLQGISFAFTEREDAELLLSELASEKITEKEARKQSSNEVGLLRRRF